jgi:hypothetical protein
MIVAAFGLRACRLTPFDEYTARRLKHLADACLRRKQATSVISTACDGWEWAVSEVAVGLGLDSTIIVPRQDYHTILPDNHVRDYFRVLAEARRVLLLDRDRARIKHMMGQVGLLLVLWDGTDGYPKSYVERARQRSVPIWNVWSSWVKYK